MSRRHSLNEVSLPPNLLKDLPTDRLNTLKEDEGAFVEYLDSLRLDDLKTVQTKQQEMNDVNFQKAVLNSEKEEEFQKRKEALRSKVLDMLDAKNVHDRKFEELKSLTDKTNQEFVLKDLQKTLRETETSSEDLADSFMAGTSELSVDQFTANIQEQRTLYWLRKVKAAKMEELLKNMRPIAAPRSPRNASRSHMAPPYLSPMPPSSQSNPTHSLPPPSHQIPYAQDPRRPSDPGTSMPPYYQAGRMPMPAPSNQPFPQAAYSSYRPPPQPYHPQSVGARPAGYGAAPPPRPAPYGGGGYRGYRY